MRVWSNKCTCMKQIPWTHTHTHTHTYTTYMYNKFYTMLCFRRVELKHSAIPELSVHQNKKMRRCGHHRNEFAVANIYWTDQFFEATVDASLPPPLLLLLLPTQVLKKYDIENICIYKYLYIYISICHM